MGENGHGVPTDLLLDGGIIRSARISLNQKWYIRKHDTETALAKDTGVYTPAASAPIVPMEMHLVRWQLFVASIYSADIWL